MKFTVKLIRESYIDIEADNLEEAREIAHQGFSDEDIENGADYWDVDSIYESED